MLIQHVTLASNENHFSNLKICLAKDHRYQVVDNKQLNITACYAYSTYYSYQ